ncbi:S8 family peptidase [Roseibium sp.]|uniref:S8 family peptidase n=1 Tax=Roseibium sp. TaxID=1936156 RepID=UPI003A98857B
MRQSILAMLATVACILSMLGPGTTQTLPPAATSQPLLVPADSLSQDNHLVLTVPLEDATQLSAVSAAIETRYGVRLAAEWPLRSISVYCLVMDTSGTPDIDALIARMDADPQIRTVQRLNAFNTLGKTSSVPLIAAQTALAQINAIAAHRVSKGDGVTVGIIDSSINRAHPDLANRISDVRDFVFVDTEKHSPGELHGTAMAGIIAANADDNLGIAGVAPKAELVDLRACWQGNSTSGRCNSFSLARAINFAILNDIRVINMSLGGPVDPLLAELVTAAVNRGFLIVAARGEGSKLAFPASLPGVLPAGNSKANDAIPAPSVDILTTARDDGYAYVSGSSVAAAHVTATVALILAQAPDLTSSAIETALRASVSPQGDGKMLDACKALQFATGTSIDC